MEQKATWCDFRSRSGKLKLSFSGVVSGGSQAQGVKPRSALQNMQKACIDITEYNTELIYF